MRPLQELLDRATETRKSFFITLIGLLVTILLGWFLAFSLPGIATKAALDAASQSISTQQSRFDDLTDQVSSQRRWFTSRYLTSFASTSSQAEQLLAEVNQLFTQAGTQSSSSGKITVYGQAQNEAETEVKSVLDQMQQQLTSNATLATQARTRFNDVLLALNPQEEAIGPLTTRFNQEQPQYLTKYMDPLQVELASAAEMLQNARSAVTAASSRLPPDTDDSSTGDPNGALEVLQSADTQITSGIASMSTVSTGLDYQSTSKNEAQPATDQAQADVYQALLHLNSTVEPGVFTLTGSLSAANQTCLAAGAEYQNALSALASRVEGNKIDYPFAYEQARAASTHAAVCFSGTDQQVTYRQNALANISRFVNRLNQVNGEIYNAGPSYQILVSYHARSTWSSVSSNLDSANSKVVDAQTAYNTVETHLSHEEYQDADTNAQNALTYLDQAEGLVNDLKNRASTLEDYRNQWAGAHQSAQSEIDSNSSYVSSYGSYSSSAKSDYDSAVSYLSQANASANSGDFESAVSSAHQAQTSASGTGNRAYQAYEDYQAAERRRAAAAAAAAAQALADSQSHSSYSSSSSSSSSYGSSSSSSSSSSCCSSSSDGGGWDSPGASDGGGW